MPTTEGRLQHGRFVLSCPGCDASMSLGSAPADGKTWMDCDSCSTRLDVTVPGYKAAPARIEALVVMPNPDASVSDTEIGGLPQPRLTGGATIAGVVIGGILLAILDTLGGLGVVLALLGGGAVVAVLIRFDYQAAVDEYARKLASARRRREQSAEEEAARLTAELRKELESIPREAKALSVRYEGVLNTLLHARREFDSRAYSPFWDAVGHAKAELGHCSVGIQALAGRVRSYGAKLRGRRHTFPLAPILPNEVPAMDSAFGQLSTLARQGETDFQFATILEHKKTRDVLIEGFSSVAGAIDGLATSFERNFEALTNELTEGHRLQAAAAAQAQAVFSKIADNTATSAATDAKVSRVIDKYNLLHD